MKYLQSKKLQTCGRKVPYQLSNYVPLNSTVVTTEEKVGMHGKANIQNLNSTVVTTEDDGMYIRVCH